MSTARPPTRLARPPAALHTTTDDDGWQRHQLAKQYWPIRRASNTGSRFWNAVYFIHHVQKQSTNCWLTSYDNQQLMLHKMWKLLINRFWNFPQLFSRPRLFLSSRRRQTKIMVLRFIALLSVICPWHLDFIIGVPLAWRLRWPTSMVMFTSRWAWPACWPIRPILGFLGSKFHKNGRFPALDADEPPCKIWHR